MSIRFSRDHKDKRYYKWYEFYITRYHDEFITEYYMIIFGIDYTLSISP